MDKIRIIGNSKLSGSINVPGSKNAALPILVSSLLSKEKLYITNIPTLNDIDSMVNLLRSFGVKIVEKNNQLILNSNKLKNNIADYDLVRKMRASILVLGPLLSRFNKATISLPGGCAIGTRPIDIHLEALSKLGATFKIENGFVEAQVKDKLVGAKIKLPFPSVGATENLIMAATLAKGTTTIKNSAREPEIVDLANSLNCMGAKIQGAGSDFIKIEGVKLLKEAKYEIMFDRIVAGTFIIAAVMLNKKFLVKNINPKNIEALIKILKKMQANLIIKKNSILILPSKKIIGTNVQTSPYPGFPTDLQAQIMVLMTRANGLSKIKESIFENRFMHVPELKRMGAKITIKNNLAEVHGPSELSGAEVMATDLRASVCLVLAGMVAENRTIVNRIYHLDRGYENLEKKLNYCGANIKRF